MREKACTLAIKLALGWALIAASASACGAGTEEDFAEIAEAAPAAVQPAATEPVEQIDQSLMYDGRRYPIPGGNCITIYVCQAPPWGGQGDCIFVPQTICFP